MANPDPDCRIWLECQQKLGIGEHVPIGSKKTQGQRHLDKSAPLAEDGEQLSLSDLREAERQQ